MTKIIKIDSNLPEDILRIELFLSNVCNYKCWYCFPGAHEGDKKWPTDLETLVSNLKFLIDYYREKKNKKKIYIHIIGGEPTIWKDFGNFVKSIKEYVDCVISISTNASRTLRWWEKYGGYIDHVIISCHWERAEVAHINAVADLLYSKNVSVNVTVLMDPAQWDKCVLIVKGLRSSKYRWPITAKELYHDTISYNELQKKYISKALKRWPNIFYWIKCNKITRQKTTLTFSNMKKKTVNHNWISLKGLNQFYGWDCNLGVDTMALRPNGDISGTCDEYLYNLDFKYNIFDKDFKDRFNPIITSTKCTKKICQCQPEINCRKQLINR